MSIVNDDAAKIQNKMEVIKECTTIKKSNLVCLARRSQVYMVHDPILIFVKSAISRRRVNYPGETRFIGLFSIFFRSRLRNSLLGGCSAMLHPRFRTRNEKKMLTSVSQKNTWANPILERSCTKIEFDLWRKPPPPGLEGLCNKAARNCRYKGTHQTLAGTANLPNLPHLSKCIFCTTAQTLETAWP